MSESYNDIFGERAHELLRKLVSVGALAYVLLGGSALPEASWSPSAAPTTLLMPSSHNSMVTYDDAITSLQRVSAEIEIAKRLLAEFRVDLYPEVETYLDNLECVLERFRKLSSLEEGQAFGNGLQLARTRFEADATNLNFWMRIARCVAPERKPLYVPQRFIVKGREDDDSDLDLTPTASWLKVRQAVIASYEDDADPSSTST